MGRQLTYADREAILKAFDTIKNSSNDNDEHLIKTVNQWAEHLVPKFGFETSLIRDIASLSHFLLAHKSEPNVADIARGAFGYLARSEVSHQDHFSELDLFHVSFICNYAVHEIRSRIGECATYNSPRLTPAERKHAEDLFLGFVENIELDDSVLLEQSLDISKGFSGHSTHGIFHRFMANIDFLRLVLNDPGRTQENKNYARAALSYLLLRNDAINDRLGIVGFLDDEFIVQLAVEFIEPEREPWTELLDGLVGYWPFLNNLVIDDGSGKRPLSEYMMINTALSCRKLHGVDCPSAVHLVLPFVGPTPFILGFLNALSLLHEVEIQHLNEASFAPEQKVLVDGTAILEYTGTTIINGEKRFGLRQYPSKGGRVQPCTTYLPMSELHRLAPADPLRAVRGQFVSRLDRSDLPLPALDYLFDHRDTNRVLLVKRHILVVTPVAIAHEMAKTFFLFGQQLKDVLPMGHISADEGPRPWSTHFGEQAPIVFFTPDLDVACAFAEKDPDKNHLVIVDSTGRNAKKVASLRRLQQFKVRTLITSTERTADQFLSDNAEHDGVWEWSNEDLSCLFWPGDAVDTGDGPLLDYERSVRSQIKASVKTLMVPGIWAEQTSAALQRLRTLAMKRGDEHLVDLDELLDLAFPAMLRLTRSAIPLCGDTRCGQQIENAINKFNTIRLRSRFLSSEEREAAESVEVSLRQFLSELSRENPKANALMDLIGQHPEATVICPDALLFTDCKNYYSKSGVSVLESYYHADGALPVAIIPGWFRRERIAQLLVPPVAEQVFLVLYEIEHSWFSTFEREREKARVRRAARTKRARLFPNIKGWKKSKPEVPAQREKAFDVSLYDLEAIQEQVMSAYRRRVYGEAKSDGTEAEIPAFLTLFEGGSYAFLTESYRANVVTHLLESSVEEFSDKADIKQKSNAQLQPGDALLFHRGSEKDVIRAAADKILPSGVRATSSLWRAALLNYQSRKELSSEELWQELSHNGCDLIHQTIKNWIENDDMIAPQAYQRDVRIVAKVTGDEALTRRLDAVLAAISDVRSAHLRASSQLAKQILAHALRLLKTEGTQASFMELDSNVVIVRLLEVDDQPTSVRYSHANRLLEGDQWHE